jgi:hypothetical protein
MLISGFSNYFLKDKEYEVELMTCLSSLEVFVIYCQIALIIILMTGIPFEYINPNG